MKFETMYNLVPKAGVLTRSSTQYTFYTAVAELVVSTLDDHCRYYDSWRMNSSFLLELWRKVLFVLLGPTLIAT